MTGGKDGGVKTADAAVVTEATGTLPVAPLAENALLTLERLHGVLTDDGHAAELMAAIEMLRGGYPHGLALRLAELAGFLEALDEWGCEGYEDQAAAIREFLISPTGLEQYLEDAAAAHATAVAEVARGWPVAGSAMRFLAKHGHDYELEKALTVFDTAATYTVENIDIGDWSHSIKFVGVEGRWNGVMFELLPADGAKPHATDEAQRSEQRSREMIEPTEADIGRGVIYRARPDAQPEYGVITSTNRDFVFVRYAHQHPTAHGQATERAHLEWEFATNPSGKQS